MGTRTILLVDDSQDLVRQLLHACSERFPEAEFVVAADGRAAIDYMAQGKLPSAVLLDLNLPMVSGFQVLEMLRSNDAWKSIPVIIFTVQDSDSARHISLRLGASYYQVKPTSRNGFANFAQFLQIGLENGAFDLHGKEQAGGGGPRPG